jgi:hypothetical protein
MLRLAFGAATLVSLALFAATPSQAQIAGTVWLNDTSDNAGACNSCGSLVGGLWNGAPSATFTVTAAGINFNSVTTGYTVGQYVNGATLSNPIGGDNLDNTHFQFVGSIFLTSGANNFVIGHDDGLVLSIVGSIGTVLNTPAQTSPVNTPFTINNPGAAGTFQFILQYNECCGPPAELQWAFPGGSPVGGVPEPSTWAMMLLGFAGLGFVFRQSRRKVSFA